MPNNENNNFNNELPKTNNEILDMPMPNTQHNSNVVTPPQPMNQPTQSVTTPTIEAQKPIIEIPQAYYDQLAKEEQEARQAEATAIQKHEEKVATTNAANKSLFFIVLTAIITYLSLYLTIHQSEIFIFVIPVYILLGTIISAIKNKKESTFPVTIMVGGMIVAVATFAMSMAQEDQMDMWTYYAIAGAVVAFVGLILSNMITKLIADRKNVKALETIGYFLFFAAVIAVPTYLYINYRDVFYKFVFQKQTVVEAETEEEFVMKTLKNRYNLNFTCDESKEKHSLTKDNRKVVTRVCSDDYGNKMEVNSIAYNEGSTEYIVIDSYMDTIVLNQIKKSIINEITSITNADEVNISLYPEKNCTFVGDCVDCDEYYEIYQKENDIENQFKVSTELNLKNYLTMSEKDYLNSQKYKMIIEVQNQFDTATVDYSLIIDNILNTLNKQGYKNNYGYVISLVHKYDSSEDSLIKTVYKVVGQTNNEKTFKDPVVVDLNSK